MDLELTFGIGTARRYGKIFQAGIFPERNLEVTPEDIKKCIENTQLPVPISDNHLDADGKKSVFDGKLGSVTRIYADPTFTTIFGEVEWPAWVEEAFPKDEQKKVSVWFDGDTYALKSVSLTENPRIKDAGFFERLAFSYNNSLSDSEETMTVEEIKKAVGEALSGWKPPKSEVEPPIPKEEPKTELKFEETQAYKDLMAKNSQLETQMKEQKDALIREKALTFATRQNEDGKIVATEKKSVDILVTELALKHERSQRDDERDVVSGLTFSETTPSRVAMLEDEWKQMIPKGNDGELLGNQGHILQFGNPDEQKQADEEYARIMGKGSLGRAILDKEGK